MKKALFILFVVFAITSCDTALVETGTVTLSVPQTKAVSGSLSSFDTSNLTWKLTAEKIDKGSNYGSLSNQVISLDSYVGEFALGDWSFTLDAYDTNSIKVYSGNAPITVNTGNNNIAMNVAGVSTYGKLQIADFVVKQNEASVEIIYDTAETGQTVSTYLDSTSGDKVFSYEGEVTTGLHTVSLKLKDTNNMVTRIISFNVYIYAGMISSITHIDSDSVFNVSVLIPNKPVIG